MAESEKLLWRKLPVSFAAEATLHRCLVESLDEIVLIQIRSHLMIQLDRNMANENVYNLQTTVCQKEASTTPDKNLANISSSPNQEDIILNFGSESELDNFVSLCNRLRNSVDLSEFEPISTIGRGKWGKVIVCTHKSKFEQSESTRLYAVKEIDSSEKSRLSKIQDERIVLGSLSDHPFVVKMHFALQKGKNSYIMMDFAPGGDLYTLLRRYRISEPDVVFYASQIILALEHLHSFHIIHRDIKPENILLDGRGDLKLADFGLAKILQQDEKTNTFCGSEAYLAPEMIARKPYSFSIDIWQLGCFIYELFVGHSPFYASSRSAMRTLITQCSVKYPLEFPFLAKVLLKQILVSDPLNRLAYESDHWERIKQARFFGTVNWKRVELKKMDPPIRTVKAGQNILDNFDDEFLEESPEFETVLPDQELSEKYLLGFDFCSSIAPKIQHKQTCVVTPPFS